MLQASALVPQPSFFVCPSQPVRGITKREQSRVETLCRLSNPQGLAAGYGAGPTDVTCSRFHLRLTRGSVAFDLPRAQHGLHYHRRSFGCDSDGSGIIVKAGDTKTSVPSRQTTTFADKACKAFPGTLLAPPTFTACANTLKKTCHEQQRQDEVGKRSDEPQGGGEPLTTPDVFLWTGQCMRPLQCVCLCCWGFGNIMVIETSTPKNMLIMSPAQWTCVHWHFSCLSKGQPLTSDAITVSALASAGSAAGAIMCSLSVQTAQASKQGPTTMHGSNCTSSGEDRGSCGS